MVSAGLFPSQGPEEGSHLCGLLTLEVTFSDSGPILLSRHEALGGRGH